MPGDVGVEFPNGTRLLVSPRMKGAAHFIAPRLNEFNDMAFVMHFLRAGEMFADVGANIGAFTVLAAGVAGARAVAFEPSPETFTMLARNVGLNGLQERVRTVNAVVGCQPGTVQFSIGLGTENHVASTTQAEHSQLTQMTTLDGELAASPAVLLKVDVEGFETEVFAGAEQTLNNQALQAIIMEHDCSGNRYGYDEKKLHAQIRSAGFKSCRYEPFDRRLHPLQDDYLNNSDNIIYIRDFESAADRLRTAPAFELGGLKI